MKTSCCRLQIRNYVQYGLYRVAILVLAAYTQLLCPPPPPPHPIFHVRRATVCYFHRSEVRYVKLNFGNVDKAIVKYISQTDTVNLQEQETPSISLLHIGVVRKGQICKRSCRSFRLNRLRERQCMTICNIRDSTLRR